MSKKEQGVLGARQEKTVPDNLANLVQFKFLMMFLSLYDRRWTNISLVSTNLMYSYNKLYKEIKLFKWHL